MQRSSTTFGLLLALGTVTMGGLALVGCANGSEPGASIEQLSTSPSDDDKDAAPSVKLPAPSQTSKNEENTDDATDDDDADANANADAGAPDSGNVPPGPTGACAAPAPCTGATSLGSISGDTGADVKTATGTGSQWFKLTVTENDNGIVGLSLLAKAELTSPPGTNFDLFVYVPASASSQSCTAPTKSATSTSSSDATTAEWGEGAIPNGAQDERTITVEVRWVSGTCSPSTPWTLNVRGNAY